MSSKHNANSFEDIIEAMRRAAPDLEKELIIPTTLGPISIDTLTNLEGWVYERTPIGQPGAEPVLVAGAPATNLINYTDEKGWITSFNVIFRSPFGTLTFIADTDNRVATPQGMLIAGMIVPNNSSIYGTIYTPVGPLGPAYGLAYNPAYFIPFERRVVIDLSLPAGAPILQTTVLSAWVSRIHIVDERTFIRSIKKFAAEQMTGRQMDRFP